MAAASALHIADVGHYVKPGGLRFDKEARDRGTSVYLPDRAVPMLPPRLTGEVCSLREGAVRRTLSVFIDFDRYGNQSGMRFTFARIRSRASLTYRGTAAVLEGGEIPQKDEVESARALEAPLRQLSALADKLHVERMRRGSLDFDLPEAQVLLDEEGMPTGIARAPRTSAHRLIEECMLAANRAVAEFLADAGGASFFRVHESPSEDNLQGLRAILSKLGLKAPRLEELKRPGRASGGIRRCGGLGRGALRESRRAQEHEARAAMRRRPPFTSAWASSATRISPPPSAGTRTCAFTEGSRSSCAVISGSPRRSPSPPFAAIFPSGTGRRKPPRARWPIS